MAPNAAEDGQAGIQVGAVGAGGPALVRQTDHGGNMLIYWLTVGSFYSFALAGRFLRLGNVWGPLLIDPRFRPE